MALALEAASPGQRKALEAMLHDATLVNGSRVAALRRWYIELDVFSKAQALVDKCRARAEALADETEPVALRQLLYYIVDSVLARDVPSAPPVVALQLTTSKSLPQLAAR